ANNPVSNTYGIVIAGGATQNTIGSYTTAAGTNGRNLISGNLRDGVLITDFGTYQNVVQGNLIGLDITGDAALGNQNGVHIQNGSSGNRIGGIVPVGNSYADFGNYISGNSQDGVVISDLFTSRNLVEDNWIGLAFHGSNNGNLGDGVLIENSANQNT